MFYKLHSLSFFSVMGIVKTKIKKKRWWRLNVISLFPSVNLCLLLHYFTRRPVYVIVYKNWLKVASMIFYISLVQLIFSLLRFISISFYCSFHTKRVHFFFFAFICCKRYLMFINDLFCIFRSIERCTEEKKRNRFLWGQCNAFHFCLGGRFNKNVYCTHLWHTHTHTH